MSLFEERLKLEESYKDNHKLEGENKNMKKELYLAAPFFNDTQKRYEEIVVEALKKNLTVGSVYQPSLDQFEEEEFGSQLWKHTVFEQDIRAIDNSDLVVAIANFQKLNGEIIVDPGTTWELGYALGTNKSVILVAFDEFNPENTTLNLMIDMGTQTHITGTEEEIKEQLVNYNFNTIKVRRKKWKAV